MSIGIGGGWDEVMPYDYKEVEALKRVIRTFRVLDCWCNPVYGQHTSVCLAAQKLVGLPELQERFVAELVTHDPSPKGVTYFPPFQEKVQIRFSPQSSDIRGQAYLVLSGEMFVDDLWDVHIGYTFTYTDHHGRRALYAVTEFVRWRDGGQDFEAK